MDHDCTDFLAVKPKATSAKAAVDILRQVGKAM